MSVLSCITWAREQRLAKSLPGPHGDALLTLATYSNALGECQASAKTIGRIIGYCRQETQGLLSDLQGMGLLHPAERRGRITVRRLRLDAPSPDQLQIDSPAASVTRLDVGPRRRQRTNPTVSAYEASMSASGVSDVGSLGATQSIKSSEEEPPSPPDGKRGRDRHAYQLAVRAWSLRLLPQAGEEELGAIREALAVVRMRERVDPAAPPVSRQEVLDYLAECRPHLTLPASGGVAATTGGGPT